MKPLGGKGIMPHYEWQRRPLWVPGTEFAEDYDYIIKDMVTVSFGDELVRMILSINVIESTQYDALSQINIQGDLLLGVYLHTDNTTLVPQHPQDGVHPPDPSIKVLYTGVLTPWRYRTFTSPTDPTDHLMYRDTGQVDIESRTQHEMVTSGQGYVQVAIETVNSTQSGHVPQFFAWNGYLTTLWRKA